MASNLSDKELRAMLKILRQEGLVEFAHLIAEDRQGYFGSAYIISPFGKQVLQRLNKEPLYDYYR